MAPIGNFAVGTLALAVAVLVNKAKLKECLKDHWKLLAVIFGTAGIYLFYLNGWLEWLQGVRDWFVKRIEIPIWALCLICISAFAAPIIIWGIVRLVKNFRALPEAEESSQQLDPRQYT